MLLTYAFFCLAGRITGLLTESGLRLLTRLLGLILVALAVEFVIAGVRSAFPSLG
jgi:small neutral amino acid transporter SnatA (MarC family)